MINGSDPLFRSEKPAVKSQRQFVPRGYRIGCEPTPLDPCTSNFSNASTI